MLLRNSISTTKKFFQKTLQNFKSFFHGSHYHKLPKTPPLNPYFTTTPKTAYRDLENFYTDFTDRWDTSDAQKKNNNITKKNRSSSTTTSTKQEQEGRVFDSRQSNNVMKSQTGQTSKESSSANSRREGIRRSCLVEQKLKELEMMDMSNVDHVLDIEEVLHYYSRLTCPSYLEIVDKFFMDMYSEFLLQPVDVSTPRSVNSRPCGFRSSRP